MKKGLITSILALTFSGLQAQPMPATPKLVVTLTIDQLRTDYMEAFSSLYGERGFKRLLTEGKVYCQMEMPFKKADRASALATSFSEAVFPKPARSMSLSFKAAILSESPYARKWRVLLPRKRMLGYFARNSSSTSSGT